MTRPPLDPQTRSTDSNPTWRRTLAGFAVVLAFPATLWLLATPVAGVLTLVSVVALGVLVPRTVRLVRCLLRCREITVRPTENVRVTITKTGGRCSN